MIKQYETVLVLTPVLTEVETKAKISDYIDFIKEKGYEIVQEDFWGIRNLAYPIQKKTTGQYLVLEFKGEDEIIDPLEVKLKRDNGILRFLTVRMDKYHTKYNDDKRKGLVGRNKKVKDAPKPAEDADSNEEAAAEKS